MNWSKVKFFILDAIVFLAAHWWLLVVLAGVLLFVFVFGQIKSCNANNAQKKLEKQRETIQQKEVNAAIDETIANVQENKVREKEVIANGKANISKQSEANFNAVVNLDSSRFDSDYRSAKKRFCADHPADSICQ